MLNACITSLELLMFYFRKAFCSVLYDRLVGFSKCDYNYFQNLQNKHIETVF